MGLSRICLVVVLVCGALARAHADPPARAKARLYYQKAGASECPEVEVVRAAVAERMGYDPFVEENAILVLVAITLEDNGSRRARISLIDERGHEYGQREVITVSPTCNELMSTVALVISVAIPAATERSLETKRSEELERLTKAAYAPYSPGGAGDQGDAAPRPPEPAWQLAVGGRASTGMLPGAAPGLTLELGVRRHAFSAALELTADIGRTQHVGGGRVGTSLYRGAAIACRHGGPFALCGLFAAGALRAHADGFNDNRSITNPYVALGGRIAYRQRLARGFVAIVHVDAESALESSSLSVAGETTWTWVAPGAALVTGLELGSTFP